MAKSKTMADIDLNSITPDSLRIIALYLSNFYIPLSTSLDGKDNHDTKKSMVKVLKDSCNFDEKTANSLVQLVYKYSLSTAKPLWVVDTDEDDIEKAANNLGSYGLFAKVASGLWSANLISKLTGFKDESVENFYKKMWHFDTDLSSELEEGVYRGTYGLWVGGAGAYNAKEDDGNYMDKKIKFCWDKNNPEGTTVLDTGSACTLGFMNGIEGRDPTEGQVFTLFTRTKGELKKVSKNDVSKVLSMNCNLYVDWVGNIILDDGVERIVVLPACSNPYALSKISERGKGDRTPINNLIGMHRVGKGKIKSDVNVEAKRFIEKYDKLSNAFKVLVSQDTKKKIEDLRNIVKTKNFKNLCNFYVNTDKDSTLFGLDEWRIFRNDDDTSVDPDDLPKGLSKFLNDKGIADICNVIKCDDELWSDIKLGVGLKDDDDDYKVFIGVSKVLSDFVSVDDIQEYDNDETEGLLNYFEPRDILSYKDALEDNIKFSTSKDLGDVNTAIESASAGKLLGIYCAYIFAYTNYDSTSYNKTTNIIDMVFDRDRFPTTKDMNIDWGAIEMDDSQMDDEIKSFVYYLLHPSEGLSYIKTWAKNKISAFFMGWHEDMVGATSSNAATGITRYLGISGYTTLPNLSDLEWTDWLLQNYNSIIVYLILIMCVVMCCYVIIGSLTVQKAIIGVFIFSLLAFLPPIAINSSVNIVNTGGDIIYGDKFNYWALVQHQTYLQDLYAATSGTKEDYKDFVLKQQVKGKGATSSDTGFSCVKLKWMSPKKDNYMSGMGEELQKNSNGYDSTRDQLLKPLLSGSISGEDFLDNSDSLYLYRDYMDITMYGLKSYNLYSTYFGGTLPDGSNTVSKKSGDYQLQVGYWWQGDKKNKDLTYTSGTKLSDMIFANYEKGELARKNNKGYKDVSSVNAIRNGFLYNTYGDGVDLDSANNYYGGNQLSIGYLLNYQSAYADIYQVKQKLDSLSKKADEGSGEVYSESNDNLQSYGLSQKNFDFTVGTLSRNKSDKYSKSSLDYFYYGLYSESPYYFFTYNILDQMNTSTDYTFKLNKQGSMDLGTNNFKSLLLQDNMNYFYNNYEAAGDGFGELRDFMNMHDFFYYVLPLMKTGNNNVRQFDDLYGMKQYDDVRVSFTTTGDVLATDDEGQHVINDIVGVDGSIIPTTTEGKTWKEVSKKWTEEKKYKFWHNYNVAVMFNMYCTWADTMWDCDYAEPEKISVAGKKYYVEFPLDPTSYFKVDKTGNMCEGRPMIFSRSEMKYYGLQLDDLTKVERKIINLQDTIYEKSLDLMNYYNFDDDVLISAMSLMELFEFNKEFSQKAVVGKGYIMYPQSYELKTLTYDAYLRLILANTTGESLQTEENSSLYERISNNTSILFGIMIVILDVLTVYVIPAFRLFFIVILFLLSILVIISSAIKLELNIFKALWRSLLAPLLSFSAISIGLSFMVSLFMYDGPKGVTGNLKPSIVLGDPTMVCIVMVVVNVAVVILYYRICKKVFKDFVTFAKAVGTSIGGAIGGTFSKLIGNATSGKTQYGAVGGVGSSAKARGKATAPSAKGVASAGLGVGAMAGGMIGGIAGSVMGSSADEGSQGSQGRGNQGRNTPKSSDNNSKGSKTSSKNTSKYDNKVSKGERKIQSMGKKNSELKATRASNKDKLRDIREQREAVKTLRKEGKIGRISSLTNRARLRKDTLKYSVKNIKDTTKLGLHSAKNETIGELGRLYYGNKKRTRLEINRQVRRQRKSSANPKLQRELNSSRRKPKKR